MPRTPNEKGTKLLAYAQRVSVGPSKQKACQFLPTSGENYRDMATRSMEAEMEETRQALMANSLKTPTHNVGQSSSKVREIKWEATPRDYSKGKQALSHYDEVESQRQPNRGFKQLKGSTEPSCFWIGPLPCAECQAR